MRPARRAVPAEHIDDDVARGERGEAHRTIHAETDYHLVGDRLAGPVVDVGRQRRRRAAWIDGDVAIGA